MTRPLRVAVVAQAPGATEDLRLRLHSRGYQTIGLSPHAAVLGQLYTDPPDVVIVDLPTDDAPARKLVCDLKEDANFSTIPVLGIWHESLHDDVEWARCPVDDFVSDPVVYPELFNRLGLAMQRIQRVFDNNPLTKLPGNISIQRAVERALGKPVAVCYLDINDFKPFNDAFGFVRGDEVIRMVARIMANAVTEAGEAGFAGHVGGDDFVFIVAMEKVDAACKTIIGNFTRVAAGLFDDETRANGYYVAKDRGGQVKKIPLVSLVIAVIPVAAIAHYGKVAAAAAELKTFAKKAGGNQYVVDRRQG
ncbi:MAG: diguanylate cyclase domain-containing protein [Nitrospirota bacterium]